MSRTSDPIAKLWEWFIAAVLVVAFLPMAFTVLCGVLVDIGRCFEIAVTQLFSGTVGLVLLVMVLFIVGAAIRSAVPGRGDARGIRDRRSEERFVRQSVRRPAADIPLPEQPTDPDNDPAINQPDAEEA